MNAPFVNYSAMTGSSTTKIPFTLLVIACACLMALASPAALAQISIPVLNPGFDLNPLAPGGSIQGNFTDWTTNGPGGVFYPTALDYSTPIPSPNNVGFSKPGCKFPCLSQNLAVAVAPYTIYILSTQVGWSFNPGSGCCYVYSPGAFWELTAGGLIILPGSANAPLPLVQGGPFLTGTYKTQPLIQGDIRIGLPLGISLANGQFDNVTVTTAMMISDAMNQFVPKPTVPGQMFQAVIAGDVRNNLNLLAMDNDPTVNPFAYVNTYIVGSGTSTASAGLDSHGNTVITFTGSNPVLSYYNFNYGFPTNGLPHFGVDGVCGPSCPAFSFLSSQWFDTLGNMTSNFPVLTVTGPLLLLPNIQFTTVYANVTGPGGTVGQWFEEPFTGHSPIPLTFTNNFTSAETLSGVEYLYCATEIPLDQLNFSLSPPKGCNFSPIRQLDGIDLAPGQSITVTVNTTPEPSTFLLLGTGLLGLAYEVRRRWLK